jgi:4-hydroxy-tetrahydrodipicolinate reductase
MGDVLRVGLIGRNGRMGRAAAAWIGDAQEMELVAAIGRDEDWSVLSDAQVALELTVAGNGALHARRLLEAGVRPVVGTSGMTLEEVAELDSLARELGLGGVMVPNFSALLVLLQRVSVEAREWLPQVSIVEAHRRAKADAPSGTAAEWARRVGLSPGDVVSVRMAGVTALHEIRLVGGAESVLLRHESHGLEGFRAGLLESLRYAQGADGFGMGLELVMGGACKLGGSV